MIHNLTTNQLLVPRVLCCDTFWSRGRGLMFRPPLKEDEALLFVEKRESTLETAIHMFFVFFPISVIWLDGQGRVVDAKVAQPFRPYYAPRRPARYFIEGHPDLLRRVTVGDQLDLGFGGQSKLG